MAPETSATWSRRLAGAAVLAFASLVLLLGLSEVAVRAYWWLAFGVPPAHPEWVLEAVYPELEAARRAAVECPEGCTRVLLLGGSVLNPVWSAIPEDLQTALGAAGQEVRVVGLGVPGHTSRDSLLKYRAIDRDPALRSLHFDLVLFYHGINEARANNVPPERFRLDYGHYAWYERANTLAPAAGRARWLLPVTISWAGVLVRQAVVPDAYVPIQAPREEWLRYGGQIRSAEAFRANLEGVAALAERRGELLATATFAIWVPDGYSRERFDAKELDYGAHVVPIELWGTVDNVVAAVEEHNRVLRAVVRARPEIVFVDLAAELAGGAENFHDICHISRAGADFFVSHLIDGVGDRLGRGGIRVARQAGAGS